MLTTALHLGQDLSSRPGIGNAAARGAIWTCCLSGLGKGVGLASQFALAWLLVPEDFGLAGMTLAAMGFTSAVGGGNLKNILIQRSNRFEEEASHIFWLALLLNFGAAMCLVGVSSLSATLFKDARVGSLLLVAAVALPIQSLSTVYVAALQRNLRFRSVALIQFATSVIQNGSALLLAFMGFGAYSLIGPLIANAIFMAIAFRCAAERIPLRRPQVTSLLKLKGDASWLMANTLFAALQTSGANIVIGAVQHSAATVGYYYWGFTVSSQIVFLLATNLQTVLFPAFNKLNEDPERQFAAVRNCCRVLIAIVTPVCVWQALLAEPVIKLLFQERWMPSIAVVQWLSLGLATQPLSLIATSVFLARGRFARLAQMTAFISLTVLAAATVGAVTGDQADVARWIGCTLVCANVMAGWLVFREFGRGLSELIRLLIPSLMPAILVAALVLAAKPFTAGHGYLIQFISLTAACLLSLMLLRIFVPDVIADLMLRIRGAAFSNTKQTA